MIIRTMLLVLFLVASSVAHAAVVLQYHHVSDTSPKATSISPALFSQHLEYIKAHGYQVVPLYEIADALKKSQRLPDKTVAITFDDGYLSVYETAYPLLKKYGYPFTIFINTQPIEHQLPQFVSWIQLREMMLHGATIANHSYSHRHLIRENELAKSANNNGATTDPFIRSKLWNDQVLEEVFRSQGLIEKKLGEQEGGEQHLFAYPYGEFNNALLEILRKKNIIAFGQHSGPIAEDGDLQSLPRFPFGGSYGGMDDFVAKVSSIPMPLVAVNVFDDKGKKIIDTVLPLGTEMPTLQLFLTDKKIANRVQCYASGQGEIQVTVVEDSIFVRSNMPMPVGRSRINCTAMSEKTGRYYWYTHPFIRKQANGDWYPEP